MLVKIPTKNISNEGSQSANSRNTNPKAHLFIEIHDLQTRELLYNTYRPALVKEGNHTTLFKILLQSKSLK
jgi:hypothetical protein